MKGWFRVLRTFLSVNAYLTRLFSRKSKGFKKTLGFRTYNLLLVQYFHRVGLLRWDFLHEVDLTETAFPQKGENVETTGTYLLFVVLGRVVT